MKAKTLFSLFALFFLALTAGAQSPIPTDAEAFYQKAMKQINQKHIAWIKRTAPGINKQKIDEAGIRSQVVIYGRGSNFSTMDIDALVSLLMMQCAKEEEQELRDQAEEMKRRNEEKKKLREARELMEKNKGSLSRNMADSFKTLAGIKMNNMIRYNLAKTVNTPVSAAESKAIQDSLKGKIDSMNDMSEMTSLRLQMIMDRRSKMISTLSNIMQKIAATQDTIVQNLK